MKTLTSLQALNTGCGQNLTLGMREPWRVPESSNGTALLETNVNPTALDTGRTSGNSTQKQHRTQNQLY